ncbi:unnamed protein product [Lampetra planeri]
MSDQIWRHTPTQCVSTFTLRLRPFGNLTVSRKVSSLPVPTTGVDDQNAAAAMVEAKVESDSEQLPRWVSLWGSPIQVDDDDRKEHLPTQDPKS